MARTSCCYATQPPKAGGLPGGSFTGVGAIINGGLALRDTSEIAADLFEVYLEINDAFTVEMLDVGAKKLADQVASVLLEIGMDKGIAGAGKGISKAARVVPEIVTHKLKRAGGGNAETAIRGQNPEVNPHANGDIPNNAQAGGNANGNAQNGLNNAKIDDPDLLPAGRRRKKKKTKPDPNWRQSEADSRILDENLGGVEGDDLDAHHIVHGKANDPSGSGRRARDILDKYQIDINSADNGTLLAGGKGKPQGAPPRHHRGSDLHSYKGIQAVEARLKKAIKGINDWATAREAIISELNKIEVAIQNGTFP